MPRRIPRMWTHPIFCLANKDATSAPPRALKEKLQNAGLGEKILKICHSASAEDLHTVIIELFPPLGNAGGYEYLRCVGPSRILVGIDPDENGIHTPKSLSVGVKQSRVYLRPLQQSLELEVCKL